MPGTTKSILKSPLGNVDGRSNLGDGARIQNLSKSLLQFVLGVRLLHTGNQPVDNGGPSCLQIESHNVFKAVKKNVKINTVVQ